MTETSPRIIELDLLRIIAVFAVILLHVGAGLVVSNPQHSIDFMVGNFFDSISRFAVPFFIILSGYFMLNENRVLPLKKIINKCLKLILILATWSGFYALVYNFHHFFPAFFFGHFHLWYMYLIIGLYLLTPILRLFVKIENQQFIYYIILLGIVFVFIPEVLDLIFAPQLATKFFNQVIIFQNAGFIIYFLMGWVILHNINQVKKYLSIFAILACTSCLTIFIGSQCIFSKYYQAYTIFYNSEALPVFVYSISLFCTLYILANKYVDKLNNKIKNFIYNCSSLTFGVYLVHASFLKLYSKCFIGITNKILYVLIYFLAITISSYVLAYILSKTKYISQLIKL